MTAMDGSTSFSHQAEPKGGFALYPQSLEASSRTPRKKSGFEDPLGGTACTAGDYDNDGATDFAVASAQAAGTSVRLTLLHNEEDGKFKDVTGAAKITEIIGTPPRTGFMPNSLNFIDYDHDGDLDLYVTVKMI